MKSYYILSDEARHAVKIFDLDFLERMIQRVEDRYDAASFYETVFYELNKRKNVDQDILIKWVERFVAWLQCEENHDKELPILGTDWAYDMIDIGQMNQRLDLSLQCLDIVINSCALLQSDQLKWVALRGKVHRKLKQQRNGAGSGFSG